MDARNSVVSPETNRTCNTLAIFPSLYLNQISPGLTKPVHLVETVHQAHYINHSVVHLKKKRKNTKGACKGNGWCSVKDMLFSVWLYMFTQTTVAAIIYDFKTWECCGDFALEV